MNPLSQPVLAVNASFGSSSFTMLSYITIGFFVMSFLATRRPLLHLSWIHSKTDSSNFLLKGVLPSPSIHILLLPFNFFCTVFSVLYFFSRHSHILFQSTLNFPFAALFSWIFAEKIASSLNCKG